MSIVNAITITEICLTKFKTRIHKANYFLNKLYSGRNSFYKKEHWDKLRYPAKKQSKRSIKLIVPLKTKHKKEPNGSFFIYNCQNHCFCYSNLQNIAK